MINFLFFIFLFFLVDVTENGRADSVYDGYFVKPEEREISIEEFFNLIDNKEKNNCVNCLLILFYFIIFMKIYFCLDPIHSKPKW